jgi:iron(III) transport system substrate-binding protein
VRGVSWRAIVFATVAWWTTASVGALAAEPEDARWSQIVAAAKREGRATLYSASVGTQEHVTIARSFEAKYGIEVDILEARASEIRERNRVEASSGRRIADVMWNGSTSTGIEEAAGMLAPIGPLPRLAALLPQFASDGLSIKLALTVYGLLINTNLVSDAAAPKSWRDLADPRWKGRILADDMRALGGGAVFFFVTYEHLGRDFHEALARQQLAFSRALPENQRRVARGEFAIYLPMVLSESLRLKGLPVRAIMPAEGAPYVLFNLSLMKDAPHPNAARLLINHFLELESRAVFMERGRPVAIAGDDSALAPELRALANPKLMGTTDWTEQEHMLRVAAEIYK